MCMTTSWAQRGVQSCGGVDISHVSDINVGVRGDIDIKMRLGLRLRHEIAIRKIATAGVHDQIQLTRSLGLSLIVQAIRAMISDTIRDTISATVRR